MHDHPILGVLLFVIGFCVVGFGYYISVDGLFTREAIASLIFGHVVAFNGVLFVVLGCRSRIAVRSTLQA